MAKYLRVGMSRLVFVFSRRKNDKEGSVLQNTDDVALILALKCAREHLKQEKVDTSFPIAHNNGENSGEKG